MLRILCKVAKSPRDNYSGLSGVSVYVMSKDSYYSFAHKDSRLTDNRVVTKDWRQSKLPSIDIEVPFQEAPLPEGVGGQEAFEEGVCLREVESVWRERLHEPSPPPPSRDRKANGN
jgi:hypothetical protein